ncbi:MAG: class II glutamine amidotransferase [Acetobacteraceae bacterium]
MCELLGIAASAPVSARFSLRRLARRGRRPGEPIDGWGVVLHDGGDVRCYREPEPAGNSAWLRFVERHQAPARIVISHIRLATAGTVSLRNTHPFVRELGGRMHSFAHNGRLPGIEALAGDPGGWFRPVGESDSERAFCALLARLAPLWRDAVPTAAARLAELRRFAADLGALGPANFLYSDGEYLFAHGDRRHQPDGRIAPPGLWHLSCPCADAGMAVRHAGVALAAAAVPRQVDVFASVPLSRAAWRPLAEGEVVMAPAGPG